jgi:hypothetical protein
MKWVDEEVTTSDVPAIMLIGGEDGVRLCVGTTSDSRVIRHDEETASKRSAADEGSS